jgi:hypothetical protein
VATQEYRGTGNVVRYAGSAGREDSSHRAQAAGHFDEAYAVLQEARKTDPTLLGGCSRAVDLIVAHLKNAGAPVNKGRRRTIKRRIQELDKTRS